MRRRHVMWAPFDEPPGLEDLSLWFGDDGTGASGLILRGGGQWGVRFRYLVEVDLEWRLRTIRFERLGTMVGDDGWGLTVDEAGTWRNDSGGELGHLAGCLGVDMTRTPVTKTLLLRRLGLVVGESAEVDVAHVMVPELRLQRRRQRYTRIGNRRYCCEGPDSTVSHHDDRPVEDVVHEFEVDADGLVLDWPGVVRRVWTFDREAAAQTAEEIIERIHAKDRPATRGEDD